MLTVIAVIAILSSIILFNSRQGQNRYTVDTSAQQFITDLRTAQNSALSSPQQADGIPVGFGIYIPVGSGNTQYKIFYNKESTPAGVNTYDGTYSVVIRTVNTNAGVYIVPENITQQSVFYKPPKPDTFINNNSSIATADFNLQQGGIDPSYHNHGNSNPSAFYKVVRVYNNGRMETR